MIRFETSDILPSIVRVIISTGVSDPVVTEVNCHRQIFAKLLVNHLQTIMDKALMQIRCEAYMQGWEDQRKGKKKTTAWRYGWR